MHDLKNYSEKLTDFVKTIAALRTPVTGCPWDLEQTHQTLRPYLLEETYEVLAALDTADDRELQEELGDLLLQIVLHCQLATERGAFSLGDVAETVNKKMIERHPHVFGDISAKTSAEVLQNWEKIKADKKSKREGSERSSMFSNLPAEMPALLKAQRIGEKVARVNFDWDSPEEVLAKVEEELGELKAEFKKIGDQPTKALNSAPIDRDAALQQKLEDEFGDLMFSVVQFGRWIGCNAEDSLRGACSKFLSRFEFIEKNSDRPLKDQTREKLEELWGQAKLR